MSSDLSGEIHKQMNTKDLGLLQSVFTSSSEGILIVNKEGKILLSNPSSHRLFGYEKEGQLPVNLVS